jgi:hypothetical protein
LAPEKPKMNTSQNENLKGKEHKWNNESKKLRERPLNSEEKA